MRPGPIPGNHSTTEGTGLCRGGELPVARRAPGKPSGSNRVGTARPRVGRRAEPPRGRGAGNPARQRCRTRIGLPRHRQRRLPHLLHEGAQSGRSQEGSTPFTPRNRCLPPGVQAGDVGNANASRTADRLRGSWIAASAGKSSPARAARASRDAWLPGREPLQTFSRVTFLLATVPGAVRIGQGRIASSQGSDATSR